MDGRYAGKTKVLGGRGAVGIETSSPKGNTCSVAVHSLLEFTLLKYLAQNPLQQPSGRRCQTLRRQKERMGLGTDVETKQKLGSR